MAAPTIPNGEEHFFPIIYSGNGQGQRVGKFVPFTDNGTIDNSCMFNRGDNPKLSRLPSSNGNRRTLTYSVWIKRGILGTENHFISCYDGSSTDNESMWEMQFLTDNTVSISRYSDYILQTSTTFEDTSKWYHFLMAIDTTQATASNRVKLYVDGNEITAFDVDNRSSISQNFDTAFNNTSDTCVIGARINTTNRHWSGYMAEVNLVDGTALGPDTFGVTDTSTGRWIPKTLTGITYGTNGFRLQFGTDSALGDDTSGNTNDFTSSGLTTSDQRTDTPTNNLPTMRPYNPSYSQTLAEGNLKTTTGGTNVGYPMCSTLRPKGSGKYYAEVRFSSTGGGSTVNFGCYAQEDLHNYSSGNAYTGGSNLGSGYWYVHGGHSSQGFYHNGTKTSSDSSSFSAGDVLGLALDLDNDTLSFYNDDGNLFGSTTFDSSKSACFAAMSNVNITFDWNFGDNGTFNGNETAGGNTDGDGNGNFYHSVPTGFKMLRQDNMPETDKGVTALTWVKNRDTTNNNMMVDSSRGQSKHLYVDRNDAEQDYDQRGMIRFLKGGYSCGEYNFINAVGNRIVSWNWVANGGTTASNEDGSITSTVQANQTAGFSIVQYTGNGGNSTATIGHGLSSAPEWILLKFLDVAGNWTVYHKSLGNTARFSLNLDSGADTSSSYFNNTSPTSSVFTVGSSFNQSTVYNYVAYCWHGVDGFSKFGSYEGNNDADGPFIYTGFKPATVIFKCNASSKNWVMVDNARDKFNPISKWLLPNSNGAEYDASSFPIDFLSNGFKILNNGGGTNGSNTFLYSAWAEHPFVGDGTSPVTAR